ncbi:MAG: hypothetical protein JNG84_05575 [Archangium sp.]|nr:hypothetical protein [Archangium sp.]
MAASHPNETTIEGRLHAALAERDAALTALAKERALVNALRLALQRRGEPVPPHYPLDAALDAPPLRYVVADALNDRAKTALGPVHDAVKALAERWSRST